MMKKVCLALLVFFYVQILQGQDATDCPTTMVVQNHRHHFLYPGSNYLSISIPGILMDTCAIFLLGPATIEKRNCSDIYIFTNLKPILDPENPVEMPEVWIEVKDGYGHLLAKQKFIIRDFPAPIASLNGLHEKSGELEASKLVESTFLKTTMDHSLTGYCSDCKVLSFTVMQISKDENPKRLKNIGSYFSDAVKQLVQAAMPGDLYLFTDIISVCGVSMVKEKTSNALIFTVY